MATAVLKLEPAPGNCLISSCSQVPVLVTDKLTFRLDLVEPSSELKEKARTELRETPDVVEQAIKELRDLLREEEGLDCPYELDHWLVRFLRPTKYYPESALKLIKNYYDFKIKHKAVYDGLLPSREKNVFSHDIITVLPRRDQEGRRILILTLGKKWKHNKVSLDEVYKGAVLFSEAAVLEPESQICGAQIIFDMDGLSLQQTWQFTPQIAKRIVDWLQDAIPLRIKGLHIINQPYIFNVVFSLFKPFLREKLKSRIVFHGTDRKSLHQYLDPSCLPESYGGTLDIPPFHGLDWYEMLMKLEPEFEKINSYGYKKAAK